MKSHYQNVLIGQMLSTRRGDRLMKIKLGGSVPEGLDDADDAANVGL